MDLLADGERYPAAAILIVDDEPGNLIALDAVLARLGHTIVSARSGEEALLRATERDFALALIDVHMRGIDGFETVRRLRRMERARATPMVMVTGYADSPSLVHQGYAAGAIDYVTKPLDPDLLRWKAASFVLLYQRGEMLERRALEVALAESARHAAEALSKQQRFLADASRCLADSSLDLERALATVAGLAVPVIADWFRVDLLEQGGGLRRIADARASHLSDDTCRPVAQGWSRAAAVARSGVAQLVRQVSESSLSASACEAHRVQLEALRAAGLRSFLVVPMIARGITLGAISLIRAESSPPYQEVDLAFAEDLASRAALALDNARLYRLAERAAAAREEMLAIVSHDLQNPLTAILMKAAIMERTLESGESTPKLKRGIEGILRAGRQMTELVEVLLDATAIEKGSFHVSTDMCDPAGLLREAADLLAPVASSKAVNLTVDIAPDLPSVPADRGRVFQVLSNLVGNAIKYTPSGGQVTLRADRLGGEVAFRVIDTGAGIAPEHLPRLFERYWQLPRKREGLGLGLYIVKGIVEAHGGTVAVESIPDHGSTFRFTLPLASG